MAQNYTTKSNLFIQFGTDKAIPELFGDYVMFGPNRMIEGIVDLTKLSTSAIILSNTTFFPALPTGELYIEKVEIITEAAVTTSSSAALSIGLIQTDRATVPANYGTALTNAVAQSAIGTLGTILTLTNGTGSGGLIGSAPASATGPYYITGATSTGTFSGGTIRLRVYYHALNPLVTGSNITE